MNGKQSVGLGMGSLRRSVAFGMLCACAAAQAANVIKRDTASLAANTDNWSAAPGTSDVGQFDATCSAGNLAALTLGGANLTLGGLQFDDSMSGPATLLSGNTLTLGASGISMVSANQNVTLNCGVALTASAANIWNVAAGRTLTVGPAINIGASSGTALLRLNSSGSGTISLNGYTENYGGDGSILGLYGGTVSLGAVNLARTANFGTAAPSAAAPISASSTSGFVVNGATATATTITIGVGSRANSSSSMLVSSGSLTASGAVVIGKNTGTSRWNPCQVSGGTLTVSDTATGLQLSPNNGVANYAELYINGGTAILGRVSYGASTDTLGGSGWTIIKGGNLYVGSGGIVKASPVSAYSANLSLHSGLLGAVANWSSSVDMVLNGPVGTPFTVQAADASATPRDITLSGAISGSGSLAKTGGGTLVLAGTNTYAGSTTISAGTVQVGNGGVSGSLGAGDVSAISVAGTLAFKRSDSVTVAGVISGTGALAQRGSGALTLTQANTYEGGTSVSAGRLLASNASGSATGSGTVTLQGGLLGGTGSVGGAVVANAGGGLAPGDSVGTLTVLSLTLNAGATNRFEFSASPANDQVVVTAADGLVLNGGTFGLFAEDGSTPWTTPGTYSLIQYSGALSGDGTDGSGSLNGDWTTSDAFNPHIANPEPGFSYAFGVSDGWLTVTITSDASVNKGTWTGGSDGNWSVAGNWASESGTMPPRSARDTATLGESATLRTVTLDEHVSLGSLLFNNENSFVLADSGNTLTFDKAGLGAEISVTAGATNQLRSAVALSDSVSVSVTNGAALFISGRVANTGAARTLEVSGGGLLGLSGDNAYGPASGVTGTTLSGGGTLLLGHGNAFGAGDVSFAGSHTLRAGANNLALSNRIGIAAGAVATVDNSGNALTLQGVISGDGALAKVGAGTLGVNTANTYAGGTVLGGGLVSLNVVGASLGSGGVSLTHGATLSLYRGNADDDNTYPGFTVPLTVPDGESGALWHSPRGTLSSSLSGAGTLNLRVNYVRGEVTGNWSGFTGQVNVSARTGWDEFRISTGGSGSATGLNMPSGRLFLGAGVIMVQTVNPPSSGNLTTTHHLGELAGATGARLSGNPVYGRFANWSVGALNTDSTFAGVIQNSTGAAMLTKVGTGTLTLTGTNTYTGATAVNAGALRVDGVITGSVVTVASGARLAGSGTLGGAVTLASGTAAVSLTNGVAETLTLTGGLTLNAGNVLALDVGAAADRIALTGGAFTRNGTVTVRLNVLPGYTGGTRTLVTGLGLSDTDGFVLEGVPAGLKVRLVAQDGDLQLKSTGGTLVMAL